MLRAIQWVCALYKTCTQLEQTIAIIVVSRLIAIVSYHNCRHKSKSDETVREPEPEASTNYSTSGKNHFHEMNGDVGMAGWK